MKIFFIFFSICIVSAFASTPWLNENSTDSGISEGDIAFEDAPNSNEQMRETEDHQGYGAVSELKNKWENKIVPFNIPLTFDKKQRAIILAAMMEVEDKTCVSFVPRQLQKDYILFKKLDHGSICSSIVGRQESGGRQHVNLTDECVERNTVLHELMHVLGYHHEHSRHDRDKHIRIDLNHVRPKHKERLKFVRKVDPLDLHLPYDYKSITHYPVDAYSIYTNGITIRSKSPWFKIKADGLSEIDIWKINYMYNCSNKGESVESSNEHAEVTTNVKNIGTRTVDQQRRYQDETNESERTTNQRPTMQNTIKQVQTTSSITITETSIGTTSKMTTSTTTRPIVFSNPLKPTNLSKPFEFPFQRMVVERRYTGRVYLAGVNRLYQLRADLQLEYKYDTGPVDDSLECPSNSMCEMVKLEPTNNYNKALAIYLKMNKLIVCGSVRQGLCRLHNIYNITAADPQVPEPVVANDKDSSSVIFVAPGPPDPSTTDTLYVASTFTDLGEYRDEVPAVATLSLQDDNLFKVAHRTINSQTQIFVERSKRKSYKIDYVYGFSSGNYSYFLTRQQTVPTASSPYQSKLVRLCQRDRHYYSYTEVPLVCRGDDGVDYNLAQSAYVSKAGFDLARNLSISIEDDVLFVVFSKGDVEPLRNHLTSASAMCTFSMRFVEAKFTENIKNCASGATMRGLDFFKKEIMCYKTIHSIDTLCGSEVNYPLGGTVPILQKPAYVTNSTRLTSVVVTTTHMYTIVFMGTEDGQLKKVIIETETEAEEYGSIDLDIDRAPIIDLQLDTSCEFLFVLTASSLSKIKLYECEQHNRWATCLSAKDPYCGWCSSQTKCIARMSCKDAQCMTIMKVTPDKIPITQAQFLKLEIQNLPTFTGQLSCVFTYAGRKLTTGAAKSLDVANAYNMYNGYMYTPTCTTVTCTTPQTSLLPPIPTGSHSLTATLSVQIDNSVDFSSMNFTFYDCASYKSCSDCAKSSFLCDWCVETAICAHNAENKCRGLHLINSLSRQGPSNRKGPSFCPAILAVDEADIYVMSGSSKDITVKTVNLMDFQTDFTCRFKFGGKTYDKDATKIENEMIKCESVDFVYSDSYGNAMAKLSVLWFDGKFARPLDNPQNIRVIMYKCDRLATNCGLCLYYLNSKFECGWCDAKSSCTSNAFCNGNAVWLNRSSSCPWRAF